MPNTSDGYSIYEICTAGLLHDIGKLFIKTDTKPDYLKKYIKNNKEYGERQYHHYLGGAFIEIAANEAKDPKTKEHLMKIAKLVVAHHKKQGENWSEDNPFYSKLNDYEKDLVDNVVSKADGMSSSERKSFKNSEEVSTTILKPIFVINEEDEIYIPSENKYVKKEGQKLKDEEPKRMKKSISNIIEILKDHLSKYEETDGWIIKLLTLLKMAGMFVPAYKQSEYPIMSLYAHSLTTGAIASAIYTSDNKKVKLLTIKLGGIQKFIGNLEDKDFTGKDAAKVLRGRSVFIELLTKAIAYKVAKISGLTPASIVLLSSGKSIIILPSNDIILKKVNDYLKSVKTKISKELLPLTLGYGVADVENKKPNFGEALKESIFEANKTADTIDITDFIQEEAEKGRFCRICGRVSKDIIEGEQPICKTCNEMREIGKKISNSKDMIKIGFFVNENKNTLNIIKEVTGVPISIQSGTGEFYEYWVNIQKEDDILELTKKENMSYKLIPSNTKGNLEEIARKNKENKDEYYSMLAFVKGDFDRLGRLIKEIVKKYGISRYVEFSIYMEYLVTRLLDKAYSKSDKGFYQLYAGGDDITFIGHPVDALNATKEIAEKLATCQREDGTSQIPLKLSMAYILMKRGMPVSRVFESGEKALQKAKKERNNIYLSYIPELGGGYKTIKLISEKEDEKNTLNKLIHEIDKIPQKANIHSFIYKLINIQKSNGMRDSKKIKMQINEFKAKYMWAKRKRENEKIWKELEEIYKEDKKFFFQLMFTKLLNEKFGGE